MSTTASLSNTNTTAMKCGRQAIPSWVNKQDSLLSKLALRETFGKIRKNGSKRSFSRLFTRIPGRLAFCLKDVIPESALRSGHIFLGFSKCGQFLMSYTYTAVDIHMEMLGDSMDVKYNYRLHWWLFLPYKRAKKVAEVMLFTNEGAPGNLHLSFCQWPHDMHRAVIYGMRSYREEGEASVNCYLTVTTAPSLQGCKECIKVASSYEEDEMAEAWNSCVRLSCLEHGMTVHTSFDLLPPHPKFEPKISMKRDGYVIINTGNILHSLQVVIEPLGSTSSAISATSLSSSSPSLSSCSSVPPPPTTPVKSELTKNSSLLSVCSRWSEIEVGVSEFTFSSGPFSPPHPSNSLFSQMTSDSDCEDPPQPPLPPVPSAASISSQQQKQNRNERLERTAEFVNQLTPSTSYRRKSLKRKDSMTSDNDDNESNAATASESSSIIQKVTCLESTNGNKRLAAAEKAYEITEHEFESEGIRENLSTFRRKRLADKKYELTDDDFDGSFIQEKLSTFRKKRKNAENVSPPPSSSSSSSTLIAKSPRSYSQDSNQVLRPLSSNSQQPNENVLCLSEVELSNIPELLSPGGMVNKKEQSCFSPRESIASSPPPPPRMHFKFTRRYIEMDDEMTSVITDIEGDEADEAGRGPSEGCYHSALPLEVHGAGYQFMPMISNSKAEKLSGNCVKVQQRSLDLECFCLDMAQKLCKAADKNYWFCNDYDVEIVDVNPDSGDVICVAVVLVQATVVTKKVSPMQKYSISSLHRRQYQGGFKFCWNIDDETCYLVDSDPLKEINAFKREPPGIWHPATSISLALQRQWSLQENGVKCITNEAVIGGTSLKTIVDSEHVVAIVLDNLD